MFFSFLDESHKQTDGKPTPPTLEAWEGKVAHPRSHGHSSTQFLLMGLVIVPTSQELF